MKLKWNKKNSNNKPSRYFGWKEISVDQKDENVSVESWISIICWAGGEADLEAVTAGLVLPVGTDIDSEIRRGRWTWDFLVSKLKGASHYQLQGSAPVCCSSDQIKWNKKYQSRDYCAYCDCKDRKKILIFSRAFKTREQRLQRTWSFFSEKIMPNQLK